MALGGLFTRVFRSVRCTFRRRHGSRTFAGIRGLLQVTMAMQTEKTDRAGFTLIELLVVITIIGILMSLLLPAVNQIRETARMTSCKSNLRQVAMAVIAYETAHRVFPPGGYTEGQCCESPSYATWTILILPFIDQEPLWKAYRFDLGNGAPENALVRETFLPVYACPSDVEVEELSIPESGPEGGWGSNIRYRPGSYRAVSGQTNGRGYFDAHSWEELHGAGRLRDILAMRGVMHSVGYFSQRHNHMLRPESAASIRDGLSQTLLIGEMTTRTRKRRRTYWAYTYTSYNQSSVIAESRTLLGDYDRCVSISGAGGANTCKRGWGSYHPETIHYALADGRVASMSPHVDVQLLTNMASIEGGETMVLSSQ